MRTASPIATVAVLVVAAGCCRRCPPPCAGRALPARPPELVGTPHVPAGEQPQILLESIFFRLGGDRSEEALGPSPGGAGSRVVDAEQAEAIEAGWRAGDGVETIAAPSIVTTEGQEASLHVVDAPDSGQLREPDPLADPRVSGLAIRTQSRGVDGRLDLDVSGGWRRRPGEPVARIAARREVASGGVLLAWSERVTTAGGTSRVAVLLRAQRLEKDSP